MAKQILQPDHQLRIRNNEAEQAIIGCLLNHPDYINKIIGMLEPDDFYSEENSLIYKVIRRMVDSKEPVDLLTVAEKLMRNKLLEKAGGPGYIADLASVGAIYRNVEYYAGIVRDYSILRSFHRFADGIKFYSPSGDDDIRSYITETSLEMAKLATRGMDVKGIHLGDVIQMVLDKMESVSLNQKPLGIRTGFEDWDSLTDGIAFKELTLLAARPGIGKTALALNIALNVAETQGAGVLVFSIEMSNELMGNRLISIKGQVDNVRLKRYRFSKKEWGHLRNTKKNLALLDITIDDTPRINIDQIRARAIEAKARGNLKVVIVDYLQLITVTKSSTREQDIATISSKLKALAKDLDVAVIALCQLNREIEKRDDKRPRLSDLRESGSLEQDADMIIFLHRDQDKNVTSVHIAKNRNGPTGKFGLLFAPNYYKFSNYTDIDPEIDF